MPAPSADACCRYRIDVVAGNVADLVSEIGGWIVDLAMAGWVIRVLLPDNVDEHSLAILGVGSGDIDAELESMNESPLPDILAVATTSYSNPRVRSLVTAAKRHETCSVVLWGGTCPTELAHGFFSVDHQPSKAAAAFKVHALGAAGDLRPLTEHEVLFTDHASLRWANDTPADGAYAPPVSSQ